MGLPVIPHGLKLLTILLGLFTVAAMGTERNRPSRRWFMQALALSAGHQMLPAAGGLSPAAALPVEPSRAISFPASSEVRAHVESLLRRHILRLVAMPKLSITSCDAQSCSNMRLRSLDGVLLESNGEDLVSGSPEAAPLIAGESATSGADLSSLPHEATCAELASESLVVIMVDPGLIK